jgi:hypothetical protein
MPGPTRQPTSRPPSGVPLDRDATIESLLVTGLDDYFCGQYERAIHAWTRVLFLDRGHLRARAYIDRARRVLAERQREADELLHGGIAAFDDGDSRRARELLTSLVQRGNADDLALALLQRMDRLEAAVGGGAVPDDPPQAVGAREMRGARTAPPAPIANRLLGVAAAAGLIVAALLVASWDRFDVRWSADRPHLADPGPPVVETSALPLPSPAELLIAQARALYTRGRLHEALRAVEGVRRDDARRFEADRLRADIQRDLLSVAELPRQTRSRETVADRP